MNIYFFRDGNEFGTVQTGAKHNAESSASGIPLVQARSNTVNGGAPVPPAPGSGATGSGTSGSGTSESVTNGSGATESGSTGSGTTGTGTSGTGSSGTGASAARTSSIAGDAPQAAVLADTPGAAGAAGGGRSNCFSADSLVTTVTGQKRMDELQIGDYVLVPSSGNVLKYEKVEMFYHREPKTRTNFVVLYTKSGRKLSLTGRHLLPVAECSQVEQYTMNPDGIDVAMRESKYAEKARKGECVLSIDESGEVIADEIVRVR